MPFLAKICLWKAVVNHFDFLVCVCVCVVTWCNPFVKKKEEKVKKKYFLKKKNLIHVDAAWLIEFV